MNQFDKVVTMLLEGFERSEQYLQKLMQYAGGKHVYLDDELEVVWHRDRLRVRSHSTGDFVQFPNALRTHQGRKFIADVVEVQKPSGKTFLHAFHHSIRDASTGEVVA